MRDKKSGICGRIGGHKYKIPLQRSDLGWPDGDYVLCIECAVKTEWKRRPYRDRGKKDEVVTADEVVVSKLGGWWHGGTDGE